MYNNGYDKKRIKEMKARERERERGREREGGIMLYCVSMREKERER